MTWQRIGENTYIDDTLVTYAEYQLFIDEMRGMGKYHHPYHWTSHQFHKGQARKPILGIRPSDAIAFCEWLTEKESSGWLYRLPTNIDVKEHPSMPIQYSVSLGYWTSNATDQIRFVWIGHTPIDCREVNHTRVLAHAHALERTLGNIFNRTRTLDLDKSITLALRRAGAFDPELKIDSLLNSALELAYSSVFSNSSFDFTIHLNRILVNALKLSVSSASPRDIELTLDLYIDLFTLQERIAGRSPAFEGIRLVKERIR